jgi:PAS domain S-box-containing protein
MNQSLDILLLEDNADDAKLVERALRKGKIECTVRRAEGREEFVAALRERIPAIVLTDFRLSDIDGTAAVALVREMRPGTPVIVVTGALADGAASELLQQGAADYGLKARLSRRPAAVRAALEAAGAEAARREAEERYRVIFHEARDGNVLIDVDTGCVVEANAEFLRQAGRTPDELRATPVWGLCGALAAETERLRFEALGEGEGNTWQTEIHRIDGGKVPVEFRAARIGLRGKPYVLVASRDISDCRAAERLLHAQLEELRRFQRVAVDRELRMEELEGELRRLKSAEMTA